MKLMELLHTEKLTCLDVTSVIIAVIGTIVALTNPGTLAEGLGRISVVSCTAYLGLRNIGAAWTKHLRS